MITKVGFYTTKITRIVEQTSCIRSMFLSIPEDYPSFRPGEVIEVKIYSSAEESYLPSRFYSICSLMKDKTIELCFDLVNKKGLSGTLSNLPEGSKLEISVPSGDFTIHNYKNKPFLFVGLGSGIGVLRGMTRDCYQKNLRHIIQFYAVNADETSIPYEEDLESDCDTYQKLEIYPIIQTGGFDIDDILERILSHTANPALWEYYIVGPYEPVNSLKDNLLTAGALKKLMHIQQYR